MVPLLPLARRPEGVPPPASQSGYINGCLWRCIHSLSGLHPKAAAMKTFLILVLAAMAWSQQFQQTTRDFTGAVRLAKGGLFPPTGKDGFGSGPWANDGRFQTDGADRDQFQSFGRRRQSAFQASDQSGSGRFQADSDRQKEEEEEAASTFRQLSREDAAFGRSGPSSSSDAANGVLEPLNLPSGASLLLGSVSSSFSCVGRPYGYYADEDNSCRVFYVCNPALFSDGTIRTYQYSFMCGEGTVFDQKELTCVLEPSATLCRDAQNYYFRNRQFGRLQDRQF